MFRQIPLIVLRRAGLAVMAMLTLLAGGSALAAERVALLLGNASYEHTTLLDNPPKDVAAMRDSLSALGFEVTVEIDVGRAGMAKAIQKFRRKAESADTALLFYAGHGMEIGGRNYLIPTDALLQHEDDAAIQAIDLDFALSAVSGAGRLSVAIIDACRNNIFPSASRAGARGMEAVSARPGQLVAFSTAPGQVARDGEGALSPFTQALTEVLARPNAGHVDVRQLFGGLGRRTTELAGGYQEPFTEVSGFGVETVSLLGGSAPFPAAPPVSAPVKPTRAKPKPARAPGETFQDCAACPKMAALEGGDFTMGSPPSEAGRSAAEGPAQRLTLEPFAIAATETTFDAWAACVSEGYCESNRAPDDFGWGKGARPVINVSWNDIVGPRGFLDWLNSKVDGAPYRLPSEAEWEYAARAGADSPYWWGGEIDGSMANYNGAGANGAGVYRRQTVPVRSFKPNAFGLYEVHGNVYEWTEDCWSKDLANQPADGGARRSGDCERAALRGGAWSSGPTGVRAAFRFKYRRDYRHRNTGFRVVKTLK